MYNHTKLMELHKKCGSFFDKNFKTVTKTRTYRLK